MPSLNRRGKDEKFPDKAHGERNPRQRKQRRQHAKSQKRGTLGETVEMGDIVATTVLGEHGEDEETEERHHEVSRKVELDGRPRRTDPDRTELIVLGAQTRDRHEEITRVTDARISEETLEVILGKRGEISESIGQEREALAYFKDALAFWQRADYLNRTAELMMKLNDDLTGAAEFARQATDLAPHKVDYLLTLGKVFERASLHKRAQGVYERALKLSPQNDTVKKALKALKRL